MMWHAFECYKCAQRLGAKSTGVVFDVRTDHEITIDKANCPLCGTECELRTFGRWPACEDGYLGVRAAIMRWWRQLWR